MPRPLSEPLAVRVSTAVYAALIHTYPRAFVARFGGAMKAAFRDAAGDTRGRGGMVALFGLWLRVLYDVACTVPREHADQWRARHANASAALARTGDGFDPVTTRVHSSRPRTTMTSILQDFRYALRSIIRRPGFTIIAAGTLALGIGANTALFSVVRSALLAPLPYAEPSQVAMIWSSWPGFDKTWVSVPEYVNYRESLRSFEDIGLYITGELSITEGDAPEGVRVVGAMPNVLDVLGVQPMLGRGFRPEEAEGQPASVVLLSYDLWQRRYGGDASVAGTTISVNGTPRTIIGVLPAGFRVPPDFRTDQPAQLWVPYALPAVSGGVPPAGGSHGAFAIGRLRPGMTAETANNELRTLTDRLNAEGVYPATWHFRAYAVTAADEVSGTLRPALMVLLGAVGLVLLIACANVANLLLVRGEDRRREMGVRTALGANTRRLVRQLLAENAILGVAGGALGIGLAWVGLTALRAVAPAELARVPDATIDGGVLLFTALISIATALLFGLWPALHVARSDVQSVLRESGRANSVGTQRSRARRLLVAGEVALAVMLAAGAGLMLRSFGNLMAIDPGFDSANVLTMRLTTPSAFYPDEPSVTRFYADLLERVRALPGVRDAGLVRVLPIDQEIGDSCVTVEGYTPPPNECAPADWQAASDGYFETLGIQLIEGRYIEATDTREAPQVIVVNEAFVKRFFADGQALGKHVSFGFGQDVPVQTVVGVVGDAHHNSLIGPVKPAFFRPHQQWAVSTGSPQRSMALVIRASRDAGALAGPVRSVIRGMDARLPVSRIQPMDAVLSGAVAQPRFTLVLLLGFGGLALALAVTGIFGVVSYAVSARTQELGIRMALGAAPRSVVWLSLRQGLGYAAFGVLAGTAGGLVATRLMRQIVYEIPTTDPLTYVTVSGLGLAIAFLASWIPARRAARTDPLRALRTD